MVRINTNEYARVKLNPNGKKILDEFKGPLTLREKTENCCGERQFQIWRLMEIFGPSIYFGEECPFVDNVIVIGDDNEHV